MTCWSHLIVVGNKTESQHSQCVLFLFVWYSRCAWVLLSVTCFLLCHCYCISHKLWQWPFYSWLEILLAVKSILYQLSVWYIHDMKCEPFLYHTCQQRCSGTHITQLCVIHASWLLHFPALPSELLTFRKRQLSGIKPGVLFSFPEVL